MDTRSRFNVPTPGPAAPPPPPGETPLGELLRTLSRDAAFLVRQEIALARAEVTPSLGTLARNSVLVVGGAVLAAPGALMLLAALVIGVGDLLGRRYALGALLVGGTMLAAGGALIFIGVRRAKQARVAPAETIATLRETGAWASAQVARVRTRGRARRPVRIVAERGRRGDRSAGSATARRTGGEDARGTPREDRQRAARQMQPLSASAPLWKRVLHEFKADDVSNQAAKVAYYFFLSLPPAVMAVFGLTGLFGGQRTGDWLTGRLTGSLPTEASALVTGFVRDVVHGDAPGPLSIGLLLALWAGSNVFTALEGTLNAAFGITAERSFIRKKAVAVGMLAACAVLFLSGSAVLLAGGGISDALGLGQVGRTVWAVLQWPLGFALITATFWLIYYVLPNKDQRGCRMTLLKASAVSAVLFVIASVAFRLYMANFGSYSATYGLLGSVIVLLLWMYVTSLVILLGGEVASEMERSP
ncbi:YhjD/YihY/BrkB family envelope integrity protein [Longimicrobium sp.]|uniref:YhjD/YihY/BrkB family envelope integrity protein n=1 Tax=Longimicrobium sp. TaxID=2029185 RepID=UPI003B3A8F4E